MARIRKTKKGYLVDFYLDGKRVRKVLPSRDVAKQYMADKTVRTNEEKYFGVKAEEFGTFKELANWYLEHPKVTRKKGFDKEVWRIELMRGFFGEMQLKNISPEHIEEHVSTRLNAVNRTGVQNKPATVNRELAILKHIFNLAERSGKTQYNPGKHVNLLKGEESRDRCLSEEEWGRYYDQCPEWYKPVALCLYVTGMRMGEVWLCTLL
jgi:integrase